MSKPLFGNRIEPACSHCTHVLRLTTKGGQALCEKHGVVAADYACSKYRYDPLRRIPHRPRSLQQFSAEDFALEQLHIEEEVEDDETQPQT